MRLVASCLAICLWWAGALAERPVAIADATVDWKQQALLGLDAQIQSAVLMARLIWTTNNLVVLTKGVASYFPDRASALKPRLDQFHDDQVAYGDLYANLVFKIASGPVNRNADGRIELLEETFGDQGVARFKVFLPLLRKHIHAIQFGENYSRDAWSAEIQAVTMPKSE
jgi:hypothetical protein